MSDTIALSKVGFEYAFWRLASERVSRDPDAPAFVVDKVAAALALYRPRVPADDMAEIEAMALTWKTWETERLESLEEEWEPKLTSVRRGKK